MIETAELHAYVDGELTKEEARRVRDAIATDPRLAAEVRAIQTMKEAVARHARPFECEEAWKGCVGRLNDLDRTKKVEGFFGRYAWAMCGTIFAAIVVGGLMNRGSSTRSVGTQDLARAVTTFIPGREAPQPSAAQKRWVEGLLGQAKASLDPNRLFFGPMQLGEFEGKQVARIPVKDASGEMALLVFESGVRFGGLQPLDPQGIYGAGKIAQMNCVAWANPRASLVLLGDRTPQDLSEVAQRIQVRP